MFPNNTRILIVDDMATTRTLLTHFLDGMGFVDITQGRDGVEGFNLITEHSGNQKPFELVLCDIVMPNLTGIELVRKLRGITEFKSLPILMVTAELDYAVMKEAMEAGATGYIRKPFTALSLKQKIQAIWDRRSDKT